jgi:hypothetical protein
LKSFLYFALFRSYVISALSLPLPSSRTQFCNSAKGLYATTGSTGTSSEDALLAAAVNNPTKPSTLNGIHLLSLQYTSPDDDDPRLFSRTVADVWRWKDAVLGDGRDFFVPKPKTLQALQQRMAATTGCDEVVVLSNCARLEVLIVCEGDPASLISREILRQVEHHRTHPHRIQLQLGWDVPTCIVTDSNIPVDHESKGFTVDTTFDQRVQELSNYWTHLSSPQEISHHLCLIAAGMATRPRRPGRPMPFRPFSSRDAHVLLQLKRTLDICHGKKTTLLLKGALEAGKAVRNVKIVPELFNLQVYGTGDDSKYTIAPPVSITEAVTEAALVKGIAPVVQSTLERLTADEEANRITWFRDKVNALADNDAERSWLHKRIHEPTMRMRTRELLNVEDIVREIQYELERARTTKKHAQD